MPMYFSRTFFYVIIGFLLLPGPAYTQDSETQELEPPFLTIYTEETFPLSYTVNEQGNGPIVGYATELLRAMLKHAEIDFKIEMVPWGRAIQAIDTRENVMVYSMTRYAEREDKYQWIGEISPLDYYFFGLKSNLELLPSTLEGAKALRIGIVRGDVTSDYLISQGFKNLINVSEPSRNPQMLKRGRIDLFPFTSRGIGPMLERNNFDSGEFFGVVRLDAISTGLFFALSNQTSAAIFQRLQTSYNAIVASGEYDGIFLPSIEKDREFRVLTIDDSQ